MSVSRSRYSRQRTSVMHVPPPPSHESTSTAELSNGRPDLHTAILSHAEEEGKKIFESSREPSGRVDEWTSGRAERVVGWMGRDQVAL